MQNMQQLPPMPKSIRSITIAKNYLGEAQIKELNLIVTMFLDTAELRTPFRVLQQTLTLILPNKAITNSFYFLQCSLIYLLCTLLTTTIVLYVR